MKTVTEKLLNKTDIDPYFIDAFIKKFGKNKKISIADIVKTCIKNNTKDDDNLTINILIACMTKLQRIKYIIYISEMVLPVWNKEYPKDSSIKIVIDMLKKYLKNPSEETRIAILGIRDVSKKAFDIAHKVHWEALSRRHVLEVWPCLKNDKNVIKFDKAVKKTYYVSCAAEAVYEATQIIARKYPMEFIIPATRLARNSFEIKDRQKIWIKLLNYGLTIIK